MSYLYRARIAKSPLAEAEDLYRRFHCFEPTSQSRLPCNRRIPGVLVRLGRLRALIYESDRGQCGTPRAFVHRFVHPADLLADPQGQRLFVIGPKLRIGKLGIEG